MLKSMEPLKICLVTSEAVPYAKTGGLADVASALTRTLGRKGHDVRLFMPRYRDLKTPNGALVPVDFLQGLSLNLGGWGFAYSVYTDPIPQDGANRYFIHCPSLYGRPGLYTNDADEHLRFALLSRAALECCQRMGWGPDVIHCNDWHTGLLPLYLRQHYGWDRLFAGTRTLLTIHNIGYQGIFSAEHLPSLDLAGCADLLYQEDLQQGRLSFLKTGLLYADVLSTVSRTYGFEIQTPEYGMGLDGLLRARRDSLVGIVNGVDYDDWDPRTDPLLPAHYSAEDLTGKAECKRHLLATLGLAPTEKAAVFGVVSRMVFQKGFDLFFDTLPELLAWRDVRLAVLGNGESQYEAFFQQLQRRFPNKVCYYRGYSEELAHLIEAGADVFLMPSRYEPCGLNQMYSLKYGTVPIVRKTGGLADTVELFNPATGSGTGFVFEHFTADGLRWALARALEAWRHPEQWRTLQQNGMAMDFSWDIQAERYVDLYRHLLR
jgi:starch synthase